MTANEVLARAMAADVGDLADDEHDRLSVEAALGELKRRGHVLAAQTAQLELVAHLGRCDRRVLYLGIRRAIVHLGVLRHDLDQIARRSAT